jgi:hypothetical protein
MRSFFRPQFVTDMATEELWLLEHASRDVADAWHEGVLRSLKALERNPFFGRERRDLKFPGVRSWAVEGFPRWVIFYGVREESLVFFRVVSGTRNLRVLEFD